MKKLPRPPSHPSLRVRAERRLNQQPNGQQGAAPAPPSHADTQRLLHELQVHQIELEMQNEELRKARDEMEAGLEKYSELYDFAPVGYLTLDKAGVIREANLTAATLLGIPRAPLVKQRLGLFMASADRPLLASFLQQVFQNKERQECDIRLVVKDQPARNVRIRSNLSESGQTCRVVMTDITEHQQTEGNVRISELRFRRLFETAHDGILLLDPNTRKITDANPFMTKLLGYPRNQFVGKELFEIGLLKDETASQAMFEKLTQDHEVRYEDLPLESQQGHHQEVEVVANLYKENGQAVIQCNIRDITIRKQVEHALHEAQLKLAHYAGQLEVMVAKRTAELTTANGRLKGAVVKADKSKRQYMQLFLESQLMQTKLRDLTRQIITAQEDERKEISRELHDHVVQTLVGINVELSALGAGVSEGLTGLKGLKGKIARTQRLVEVSVNAVHRFARELRPPALDDLGLIPALHAYNKNLAEQKNLKIHLTAFAGVEALEIAKRTVLFRIAQEAMTNVIRHAHASSVKMSLTKIPGAVRLEINDNGKSFQVRKTLLTKTNKRLGLVGMRERIEMVGGSLTIESAPGQGTTVRAELPFTPEKNNP